MEELRPTGISSVLEVPWGTHFCQFYDGRDDLVDSLVSFFKAGLEQGEKCLWVTAEPFKAADAGAALAQAVPDLEERKRRGQLEIIDHRDWYMKSAGRTSDEVLQGWVSQQDQALVQGYAGLRLTGNMYWLEPTDWTGFMEYEARVTATFKSRRIIGLCSYCLSKCQSRHVLDVVRSHEFAVVRQNGGWQRIESDTVAKARGELAQLGAELERKVAARTSQLEGALRARDQFLAASAQELKPPIASLQLYLEGLMHAHQREPFSRADAVARLDKTKEQSARLEKLIDKLLDVSRATSGELQLELGRADLSRIASDVAGRLQLELQRAHCELKVDAGAPAAGVWDRTRLEQAVAILVSNAAKYAPGSKVRIAVACEGETATLTVSEEGPGGQDQSQPHIFDRFFQGPSDAQAGGFGLGLWMVREIVEAHGGSVSVRSGAGTGASFTLRLPRGSEA